MDRDHISQLVQLGSTASGVQQAQSLAKREMDRAGYGSTLHNACAATLSEFLNLSSIDVPVTLGAGKLAGRIAGRGWNRVDVGSQHAGDVAVAENDVHIFLVIQTVDRDVMIIADNQAAGPHRRQASGDRRLNHSPVAYFLRADGAVAPSVEPETTTIAATPDPDVFPQVDEDTGAMREPFDDDGRPRE